MENLTKINIFSYISSHHLKWNIFFYPFTPYTLNYINFVDKAIITVSHFHSLLIKWRLIILHKCGKYMMAHLCKTVIAAFKFHIIHNWKFHPCSFVFFMIIFFPLPFNKFGNKYSIPIKCQTYLWSNLGPNNEGVRMRTRRSEVPLLPRQQSD